MKKIFLFFIAISISLASFSQGYRLTAAAPGQQKPTTVLAESEQSEHVVMHLDDVFANYYKSVKFSKPGAYDFFFNYANMVDDNGFPWLLFHILQPTDDGICNGTYSMADGTLRPLILRSMEDYITYKGGTPVNEFSEATVTMTNKGGDNWNMVFHAIGTDGTIYDADTTLPVIAPPTEDTNDPILPNGGGGAEIINTVELDMNYAEVELWTNPQFSEPFVNHYDYYFQLVKREEGAQKANRFPYIEFDIYLPVKGALQEGTYRLGDKMRNFFLIRNTSDEKDWDNNAENSYGWEDGTVTLTNNGGDNWTIDVRMLTYDGTCYTTSVTTDINIRWRDEDPFENGGVNDTFNKESTTAGNYTVNFDLLDTSEEHMTTSGFFYVNLESSQHDADGKRFVSEFFFRIEPEGLNVPAGTYRIPAGTYPLSYDDESYFNFVASHGDGMSGGRYPSYIALYDEQRITDVWYLTKGNIKVDYDENDELVIDGNAESHFGSTFHFTYNLKSSGIHTVTGEVAEKAACKQLQDGQVVIRRNNTWYHTNGTRYLIK